MNCFIECELIDFETATILMVYNTTVEYALSPYCSLAVYFVKESTYFVFKISLLKLIVIHNTTLHFTTPAAYNIIQNVMLNVWFSIIIIIIYI